ncbi:MAG: imelysin family protein, partial [Mucilaginibacter sp.]
MMTKKAIYRLIAIAFIAIIFTMAACKKGGQTDSGTTLYGSYDQNAMLANVGNNIIVHSINNFTTSSASVAAAISSFVNSPDASSLAAAQASFQALALSWAATAPFDFGPLSDNLWYAKIDTWPVNPGKIENAVSTNVDASTQGSDVKGLKALEYLLFDKKGKAAVLAKYQGTDVAITNRKNYLVSVSKNISAMATDLANAWSSSYSNTFSNSKGNDVSSSVSLLVNTFSLYLDEVKNLKIGNPIGMGIKVNDGQPHADKIEYLLTEESLQVML